MLANLLFALIDGPHLKKTHGKGSRSTARKPSNDVAQPMPMP